MKAAGGIIKRRWKSKRGCFYQEYIFRMIDHVQTLRPQPTSVSADIVRMDKCFQDLIDKLVLISKEHANSIASLKPKIGKFLGGDKDKIKKEVSSTGILCLKSVF